MAVQADMEQAEAELSDAKAIKKEGLSEYFLYTIEGTETIPTGWSKRLLSFESDDVPVVNLYKYEQERYGTSVMRFLSFKNDEEHKLGDTPIPGGVLKVYRTIDRGAHLAYVGQSAFKYIPVDEDVELNLGAVADVVVEPTLMDFKTENYRFEPNDSNVSWDELRTYEVKVKNARHTPVEVRIQRNFDTPNWKLKASRDFEKVDLDTVKFTLRLGPRSQEKFEYVLRTHHKQGLIGWWKFDEARGKSVPDSSGRANHGTIEGPGGGPNWEPYGGRTKGCLVFNDDTAVILPTNVFSEIEGEVAVCVWLKDALREGMNNWVFDAGDGSFRIRAAVVWEDGHVFWQAGNEDRDVVKWTLAGDYAKNLKGWHHWAFVKNENAGQMSIYFDGAPAAVKGNVDRTLSNICNKPFKIGALTEHQNDFKGRIDDFRVFNYALSAEGINQLYQAIK